VIARLSPFLAGLAAYWPFHRLFPFRDYSLFHRHPERSEGSLYFVFAVAGRSGLCRRHSKNKLQKSDIVSAAEKPHPTHHDSPAIHHKLTSKNHVLHTTFLKNPCKKHLSTT
jgi:hypothetical protein